MNRRDHAERFDAVHVGPSAVPGRTVYSNALADVHLHVVDHESDEWHRQLALRDHLRSSDEARAAFRSATAEVLAAIEADALDRAIERTGFGPVSDIARAAPASTTTATAGQTSAPPSRTATLQAPPSSTSGQLAARAATNGARHAP